VTAAELLSELRRADVRIWLEGDVLHHKTPAGSVSPGLLKDLEESRAELSALLRKARRAAVPAPLPIRHIDRDGEQSASFAQEQLWLLNQFAPEDPAYNISTSIRLKGPLNHAALTQTLGEVIRRHDVLRSTFRSGGGRPLQIVQPYCCLPMPLVDIRSVAQREKNVFSNMLASREARRPFDLSRGPLLKTRLLALGERDHIVLFTMHHIVSDGWSIAILVREVAAIYEAFSSGAPSPLPELEIQYADYAYSERELLKREVLQEHLEFWKRQLEDAPMLDVPTDKIRPAVQTSQGASVELTLADSLFRSLDRLSRRHGVTLFMTLLAAFKTLLHLYSDQDEIVIGTSVANRNWPELKGLIGPFVNTVVLRTSLSGDPTVQQLLLRVRENTLAAQSHQELPFQILVNELRPDRHSSRNPFFQVLFAFQNTPVAPLELKGVEPRTLDIDRNTAQFDLSLTVDQGGGNVCCRLVYNTDLFEEATAAGLLDGFHRVLEGFTRNPEARISALSPLGEKERQHFLVDWNATSTNYPEEECLHRLIEQQAARTPDSVAVTCEERHLTYGELNRRANQLARYLKRIGVAPEVSVGVLMERCPEMLVGLIGILKAGGVYIPLDPASPAERQREILQESAVVRLLSLKGMRPLPKESDQRTVFLDSDWDLIAHEHGHNLTRHGAGAHNLAYVMYTSGSTGKPKGVMITHRGLVNYLSWAAQHYRVAEGTAALVHSSIAFDLTLTGLFCPLLVGGRVVLIPDNRGLEGLAKGLLDDRDYVLLKITPSHLQMLNALMPASELAGRVHALVIGGEALHGEPISPWLRHAPDTRVINEYGPTETVVGCCVHEAHSTDAGLPTIPIGHPVANTKIYVLNQYIRESAIGAIGEIYVGGDGVARGYLKAPELTAEKFIPDPFDAGVGSLMYATGDLARYRRHGGLEYLGRRDHQIKIRGFRVELDEIESLLGQQPGVRHAIAAVREDKPGEKRIVAYIIPEHADRPPSIGELRENLGAKLPGYMMPAAFVTLKEAPLSRTGKIERRNLPLPETHALPKLASTVVRRSRVEDKILRMWETVLSQTDIGVEDNFFELGGNSLLLIQVFRMVKEEFGADLKLTDLLQYPTVAALARYLTVEAARSSDLEDGRGNPGQASRQLHPPNQKTESSQLVIER
jgi:amino acid adenylation domain-containing protein